ncbi:DUF91 domain-containing protein [candidate division KSB1 bacterium]|nr:DUF91 domain-containing protein [candidate division KSB1 bacterium]
MPEQVRLWKIKNNILQDIPSAKLDLESRLESWIKNDITILGENLLPIGTQVETAFDGYIDILCLDGNGDLVIVELKRDKTPREVSAQVLDYATWVQELSHDQIASLADVHLNGSSLEEKFREKFDRELPEILNENHSMLIVGSRIDPSTERIITYLSETYGVNINAITFQYFSTAEGDEIISRIFLVEPEKIEYQSRTKGSSKRRRNLTWEELFNIAEEKGVLGLYKPLYDGLSNVLKKNTTLSSVAFAGELENSLKTIIGLYPPESSVDQGLRYRLYLGRFCRYFSVAEQDVIKILPHEYQEWNFTSTNDAEYSGFEGYFKNGEEVGRFLGFVNKAGRRKNWVAT